jgi:transcription-repair coupling factor (superfamily II helicase)
MALKEAEDLGSGYRIAMADLEIRGAGNILGREQSGSVNKIGLNLYCQMLSEAVEKLKIMS